MEKVYNPHDANISILKIFQPKAAYFPWSIKKTTGKSLLTIMKPANSNLQHQLARHDYNTQAIRHFLSMLRQTYATTTTWLITSYPCTNSCHLPRTKSLKLQALKEKTAQLHT